MEEVDDQATSLSSCVKCAAWIRRPKNAHLVVVARSSKTNHESVIEIFAYDSLATSLSSSPKVQCIVPSRGAAAAHPCAIAVHPNHDSFICFFTDGHSLRFHLLCSESPTVIKLVPEQLTPLETIGHQMCAAFSADGSMLATGGADGHLRIFDLPTLGLILDEPKAHTSIRDLDFSHDSNYLASTSTDGSGTIWNMKDDLPFKTLAPISGEKIELCRFFKDGNKPFLFCTGLQGDEALTAAWDMSTWTEIGSNRLVLDVSASVMSISLNGKYLAMGSKGGDLCVVDVEQRKIRHLSKSVHPGACIASLEFCPSERVVLSTSGEWGTVVTKLNVDEDWESYGLRIILFLVQGFKEAAKIYFITQLALLLLALRDTNK